MKAKLLALLLILCLILPLPCSALAEAIDIEAAPEAADVAAPEIDGPLAVPEAPAEAPLSNAATAQLSVTYTGPALSKVYDKTTDVTDLLGQWLLDRQPLRSDFTLSGVEKGYESVRITQYSVGKFEKADAGSYHLKVTFTLAGDDAAHYTAAAATIPATITKRPVTVKPLPGLRKVYGSADPVTLGFSGVPSGLLPLTLQEIAAGKKLFTGAMARQPGENVGRYKFLPGTLDFDNPNYEVTVAEEYFTIAPKPITDKDVILSPIEDQGVTGKPVAPAIELRFGEGALKQGRDFTAEFADNVAPGVASVKLTGIGNYTGVREATFNLVQYAIADAKVEKIPGQVYTGKALKPAPALTFNGAALKKGTDYTLAYKNNKGVGKATVTITGKGKFTGSRTVSFSILPPATALSKAAGGKKKISVKWKKTASVRGYQIAWSATADFNRWEDKFVRGAGKTSATLTGLKSKKTYYVRVRTYKRVNGKNYYSAWSAAKKVRTK